MDTSVVESVVTRDNQETVSSVLNSNGRIFTISDDRKEFYIDGITISFKNEKMVILGEGINIHNDNPAHKFWVRFHQLLDLK